MTKGETSVVQGQSVGRSVVRCKVVVGGAVYVPDVSRYRFGFE
jgi:hypothetical protein